MINWQLEVEKRKDQLIKDTQKLLQIKSILDENTGVSGAPFGKGIHEAYSWMLSLAEKDGFETKDVDGYGGHIQWAEGKELIGVLCHLDVVPEGEGWKSPPFAAEIRDGKIFARGAIDDKGPTMAAYYGLKIVKELGLPLRKRVRIIIGNDEESQWRCVKHYFTKEEMPAMGFAPDADFPIIYAEKGIADFHYCFQSKEEDGYIQEFISGERLNMVPEQAKAVVRNVEYGHLKRAFTNFLQKQNLKGSMVEEGEKTIVTLVGKSAHGMEPDKGINSGIWLAKFLFEHVELQPMEQQFFSVITPFLNNSRGNNLGIAYKDPDKGEVTLNVGKMKYNCKTGGEIGVNLRYPQGADFNQIHSHLQGFFTKGGFSASIQTHEPPHAVEKDHPLIETLLKVYEQHTGEKGEPIAIGGGTYARSLKAGVAFGPMFPSQEDVAHEADEYISIEHLLKATAIYAQAIYELAK
ncbi:MAG: dipeptidase PepV [Bacillus sp. (in: Bacteria)]|nr:dipeptidase PepV [Bacillus sp. (in: firmicutes)]